MVVEYPRASFMGVEYLKGQSHTKDGCAMTLEITPKCYASFSLDDCSLFLIALR